MRPMRGQSDTRLSSRERERPRRVTRSHNAETVVGTRLMLWLTNVATGVLFYLFALRFPNVLPRLGENLTLMWKVLLYGSEAKLPLLFVGSYRWLTGMLF